MSIVARFFWSAVLALGATAFSNSANALPITWNLIASYDDGVTASGSYVFDADTSAFSNIAITTSLSETLTFENPQSPSTDEFLVFLEDATATNGTPTYSFSLAQSMTNAGGTINILTSLLLGGTGPSFGGVCAGDPACRGILVERSLVSGSISAVPLPAGGALLLSALFGFGVLRRFRNVS